MRLINVETLEMKEFFDVSIPPYAILSHTWGSDEVSYQDWQAVADFPALLEASRPFSERLGVMDPFTALRQAKVNAIASRAGYQKILDLCSAVRACPFDWKPPPSERPCWAWVDTCCIDKTSSAELSEAINSMFKWYAQSEMCLVYLSDVPGDSRPPFHPDSAFRTSRWFTRGWTLQELLAPSVLCFYSQDWKPIGWLFKKHEAPETTSSLVPTVAELTGIPIHIISGARVDNAAVSAKMSWVSKRQTTRVEDMAYCMLGLFGVHMPLLYGEGHRAFTRLQEEIIKVSVDHTIFAWRYGADMPQPGATKTRFNNLLAESPSDFVRGNPLSYSRFALGGPKDTSFQMTNRGLHIRLPILLLQSPGNELDDLCCVLFNCREPETRRVSVLSPQQALAIPLVADDNTASRNLDDDTTLRPLQGGMPVLITVPPPGGNNYYSVMTRRIFIPRSPEGQVGWTPTGRHTEIITLRLRSMVYTETPWRIAEVFPPLSIAEYWGTEDLTRYPLTGLLGLESTYSFGLRRRANSPNNPPSTLIHYFRLKGDRDLVLVVEMERPLQRLYHPKIRICMDAATRFPHRSLLNEFLSGGLVLLSKRCEWHQLSTDIPSTKRLHLGGFDYDIRFFITTGGLPIPGGAPAPPNGTIKSITLLVTSLSAQPTNLNSEQPFSNDKITTTSSFPQPAPG